MFDLPGIRSFLTAVNQTWVGPAPLPVIATTSWIIIACNRHFTAVDGNRDGVDVNSKQNTAKMGNRRQLAPIAGQSGLRPGGGWAKLPLEDVLEDGDMSLGNILNGTEPGVLLGSQLCKWRQSNTQINRSTTRWRRLLGVIAVFTMLFWNYGAAPYLRSTAPYFEFGLKFEA